jgi:hypothetical protein
VGDIVQLSAPIVKVLRLADTPAPTSSKIYAAFERCKQGIEALDVIPAKKAHVLAVLAARRDFVLSDLHKAAYAVDPEFRVDNPWAIPEVAQAFIRVVQKLVPDADERVAIVQQHAVFRSGAGLFGSDLVQDTARKLPTWQWWDTWSSETPELSRLAMKLVSQTTSASSCERNWSSFEYIHSKKRNRLSVKKSSDLVYAFSNLRLRRKVQAADFEEAFVDWNSDSDAEV